MGFGDLPLSPDIPESITFSGLGKLVTLGDRASNEFKDQTNKDAEP